MLLSVDSGGGGDPYKCFRVVVTSFSHFACHPPSTIIFHESLSSYQITLGGNFAPHLCRTTGIDEEFWFLLYRRCTSKHC